MTLYEIFLQTDDWLLQLPINPESVTTKGGAEHKKYDMLAVGETKGVGKPNLQSWEIKSYFPANGQQPSSYYVEKIQQLAEQKQPFRLIINRQTPQGAAVYDTNTLVLLEKWSLTDKGGEEGDVYYEVTLSEYKAFKAKTL